MSTANAATTNRTPTSVGARRRLKLLLFVVALFMSWAVYTLVIQQNQTSDRANQMRDVKVKLSEAQKKNETLSNEITRLKDEEYIGQIARQQGMSLPGERAIHMEKPAP